MELVQTVNVERCVQAVLHCSLAQCSEWFTYCHCPLANCCMLLKLGSHFAYLLCHQVYGETVGGLVRIRSLKRVGANNDGERNAQLYRQNYNNVLEREDGYGGRGVEGQCVG